MIVQIGWMWVLITLAVLDCLNVVARDYKYTNTWALQINADTSEAVKIAEKHGLTYKLKISSSYYLFEHKSLPKISSKPHRSLDNDLINDPLITWFAQQVKYSKVLYNQHIAVNFSDARWNGQVWYLNPPSGKGMNIDLVWQQGITGKGIVNAVVDDGLQQSHPDLRDNYDPLASLDLVDLDGIPNPMGENSGHGNRCAGVIAATANNSECGVGVAFNSKLGGIRLFENDNDGSTDAMEALAFQHNRQHIDIYSCSWGPEDTGWTIEGPGKLANEQLEEGAKIGRHGKGSIFVFAAGNGGRDYDNCAYNGYANSVFTITVSGVSINGTIPGYAERCSAIMACAYSQENVGGHDNIITSDINGSCTATFSQTSAATAMASGIIALALEVNSNLTWRDVQHLIAHTSNSDVLSSDADWMINAAGLRVSSYFGFGLLDAAAMVNYSRSWHTVPEQIKCRITEPRVYRRFSQYIEVELNVSQHNCGEQTNIRYLEHVVVTLNARFARRGYLEGFVTSPSGTTSQILPYRPNDVIASEFNDWPILSLHFWGENPQGNWRLRLQNHYPNFRFSGELLKWSLVLYGTATHPLQGNYRPPKQFTNRTTPSTPSVKTEFGNDLTNAPGEVRTSHGRGLSGLAIALFSSALFLVLAVTCGAVFFKAGGSSCRRKSNPRTLTSEINTTETKAVERNSFRMESKL